MNGFAALDIPPCRRYVVVKATAGFAVCRLILKLLLFYSCLDFTQNLGKTQENPYEHNAFTSHLMLDSDEVYQMTKRGLDAAQISAAKRIHLNLVLVKLLELHHLGYDLRHYHAQHHAFIKQFNLPAHFQFDVAAG